MAYTQILYHIVIVCKFRKHSIPEAHKKKLYYFIWDVIRGKNAVLYQIGGVENHLHILCSLPPELNLMDFVQAVKGQSSFWLGSQADFPNFIGWSRSYAAFSVSYKDKPQLVTYIKNQYWHHEKERLAEELSRLVEENGLPSLSLRRKYYKK
jgi:REP element-mobilizing transposase RayT